MNRNRVEMVCRLQPALRSVNPKALEAFLTPPSDPKRLECWFSALMVLLDTGNLVDAVKTLVSCLTGVQGAGSDKVLQCALAALWAVLFQGQPLDQALVKFIQCLLGNGGGNGGDELGDPNLREVPRCV